MNFLIHTLSFNDILVGFPLPGHGVSQTSILSLNATMKLYVSCVVVDVVTSVVNVECCILKYLDTSNTVVTFCLNFGHPVFYLVEEVLFQLSEAVFILHQLLVDLAQWHNINYI